MFRYQCTIFRRNETPVLRNKLLLESLQTINLYRNMVDMLRQYCIITVQWAGVMNGVLFNLMKFINLAATSQKTLVCYKDQPFNVIYKDNKTGNVRIT